ADACSAVLTAAASTNMTSTRPEAPSIVFLSEMVLPPCVSAGYGEQIVRAADARCRMCGVTYGQAAGGVGHSPGRGAFLARKGPLPPRFGGLVPESRITTPPKLADRTLAPLVNATPTLPAPARAGGRWPGFGQLPFATTF